MYFVALRIKIFSNFLNNTQMEIAFKKDKIFGLGELSF